MKKNILHNMISSQKNFAKRVVMVIVAVMMASGVWATDETFIFTAKGWTATLGGSAANWTSDTSGSNYEADRGVANNGVNGACTSPSSYSAGIYCISIDASSNGSGGEVTVKIGSQTIATKSIANANHVTYSYTSADYSDIATLEGSVQIIVSTYPNSSKTLWIKSVTISYATATYTVTYDAGTGSCIPISETESQKGIGVTLPTASPSSSCAIEGWTFAGWKRASGVSGTTAIQDLIAPGIKYHPTANETLYAVYQLGDVYSVDFENILLVPILIGISLISALNKDLLLHIVVIITEQQQLIVHLYILQLPHIVLLVHK